ncbi:MAG: ABC transporter permease [Reyranella sp.]|uniref:ABC transporter permease n=1 Tax=Reyranella sp. TaxID=1929291 RepID=UPI00120E0E4B|nr:ABC transporter permease [Reyranella sp.]TAJ97452.1 MAG: ABC transporter permease [Reyranella sp.]TBR28788.1 MAG: ABC transporter permease [Reyranella sp.]
MTDIANSEASLGSAVRPAGNRPALIFAARVLFLVLILAAWQGAVAAGLASAAFVSTPIGVAQSLWQLFRDGEILPDLGTTVLEIVIAFSLSVVFGISSAVVLDRNDWLNRIVSPFLTAFNSMPRIALGPLFILWFGIGIASKVVLAFSLGYFIMLLSTLGGLKNVDRDLLLMSRLFGASELRLFRHVRFPWALPGIFAGLKLTLIYCSAGAVIGEMIAAKSGLGVLLQSYSGRFDIAGVLALILIVALLVMTLTALMDMIERRLLEWSRGSTDVPG